jgi:hypothetical protein
MTKFEETIELIRNTATNDPFELTEVVLPAIAGQAHCVNPVAAKAAGMESFPIPGCKHPLWKQYYGGGWILRSEQGSSILTRAALVCCTDNQLISGKLLRERLEIFGEAANCKNSMAALSEELRKNCP